MLVGVAIAPLLVLATCAPPSHPLIAEVFYDAVGDDTGLEFVELFNPNPAPYPLAGARLEAGDGAGPGRWTLRWTGAPQDSLPARGRFLIGGARVVPAPDALVALDLQNGPDAVRVVWADGTSEVVGYGDHALPEYFCGAPAADAVSGQSLARLPDDSDLGSNALDFRPAAPSPRGANRPGRDAALLPGSLVLAPEQPRPGEPASLLGALVNRGSEPIAAGEAGFEVSELRPAGDELVTTAPLDSAVASSDTTRFAIRVPGLPEGKHHVRLRVRLAADESAGNDDDSLHVRVGPGPLEVTEIQFHPTSGEGEWVEVRNRSGAPVSLADQRLSDRHEVVGTPAGGVDPLPPDSLALLVQDRAALLARFPALPSDRLWEVRPWASLNNSDDSSGVADAVVLREGDGTLGERRPYSASGVPAGVPLERRADGSWGPATDALGSPLAPPRPLPPLSGRFAVVPRRFPAGATSRANLAWSLPWARGRIAVELYDLAGRRVARLLPETAVAGRGARDVDAGHLPAGVYVVVLFARAESGDGTLTAAAPMRVDGGAP